MSRRIGLLLWLAAGSVPLLGDALAAQEGPGFEAASRSPVVVASKPFAESFLLAEMFAQMLEARGVPVERRPGLGATEVAFAALRSGAIDVYPEYTGTGLVAILGEVLADSVARDATAVFVHVSSQFEARYGLRWLPPLGFENTYAVSVRRETAERMGLRTLTDLARVSESLSAGLTSDFIGRPDGLAGLAVAYDLRFASVRSLSPALKYQALASEGVDVVDGYSTDGLLDRYDLVTLEDDRRFFPPYEAAALVSETLADERPEVVATLTLLSGRLDEERMRGLNRRVEVDREPVEAVARDALESLGLGAGPGDTSSEGSFVRRFLPRIGPLAVRHLMLTGVALGAAALVAIPLGLVLERARKWSEIAIGGLGVIQTIPSIALLAFMIPVLGVGVAPALVALWLYALYPIARGTYTGVRDADPEAVEATEALGATAAQRLLWVRLPLAAPVIMAGVRTSAVITVGAATLAAFIGAGGLGEPIVQGLALADSRLILSGAVPAALLALLVDGVLWSIERQLRPAHLRPRLRSTPILR